MCCRKNFPHVILLITLTLGYSLCMLDIVTAKAEEQVMLQGWVTVTWGDESSGASTGPFYQLTDTKGKEIDLVITELARRAIGDVLSLNRKYVGVQGTTNSARAMTTNGLSPPVIVNSVTVVPAPPSSALKMNTSDAPGVSGSRPWVSIMCKFSDIGNEPENLSYFQDMYANTKPGLDHYWREQSYDTVNISGSTAAGWFELDGTEASYNPSDTMGGTDRRRLADDCIAAADDVVDYSLYDGINMMFNSDFDNGYAWGGTRYMTLDGVSRAWSITWEPPWGYSDITIIAHEMGHGFGLPHSSGEYGQTYDNEWDVMSDSWSNCTRSRDVTYGCMGQHTISYHKDRLGWIPDQQQYLIGENSSVTLSMEQLALPATGNYKMIRIPIAGSDSNYYTVEVRRQVGYDYKLPGQAVIIHEIDTYRTIPAQVIDVDGNGDTGDSGARWEPGEVFSDADNKVFVDILSTTATGFDISVRLGDLLSDVNLDGFVGLDDVIIILQIVSGTLPSSTISLDADVNDDQRLGLAEVIYGLQQIAAQ